MKKSGKFFANTYLALILAVLYLPIIVIIVFSFTNNSNFSFANGFSFEAYKAIFTGPKADKLLDALKNTISATAMTISLLIIGSWLMVRVKFLARFFR